VFNNLADKVSGISLSRSIALFYLVLSAAGLTMLLTLSASHGALNLSVYLLLVVLVAAASFMSPEFGALCLVLTVGTTGWLALRVSGSYSHIVMAFVLAAIIGFIIRYLICREQIRFARSNTYLFVFGIIAVVSGMLTLWRFLGFETVPGAGYINISINVWGISSDTVIRNCVYSTLNYISWGAILLLGVNIRWDDRFIRSLRLTLLIILVANCSVVLLQETVLPDLFNARGIAWHGRAPGLMTNYNALGHAAALILVFIPLLMRSQRWNAIEICVIAILSLICLAVSGSRSALLYIIVAFIIYAYIIGIRAFRRNRKKLLFIIAIVAFMMTISATILLLPEDSAREIPLIHRIQKNLSLSQSFNEMSNKRLEMWSILPGMVARYPLTGVGSGSFFAELGNYSVEIGHPFALVDNALNFFFHVAAELGLPALVISTLALVLLLLPRGDKRKNPNDSLFDRAGWVPIAAYLPALLFGPHFYEPEVMVIFWLLAAAWLVIRGAVNVNTLTLKPIIWWTTLVVGVIVAMSWSSSTLHPAKRWGEIKWVLDGLGSRSDGSWISAFPAYLLAGRSIYHRQQNCCG